MKALRKSKTLYIKKNCCLCIFYIKRRRGPRSNKQGQAVACVVLLLQISVPLLYKFLINSVPFKFYVNLSRVYSILVQTNTFYVGRAREAQRRGTEGKGQDVLLVQST